MSDSMSALPNLRLWMIAATPPAGMGSQNEASR